MVSFFIENVESYLRTFWNEEEIKQIAEVFRKESLEFHDFNKNCPLVSSSMNAQDVKSMAQFAIWLTKNSKLTTNTALNELQSYVWGYGFKNELLKTMYKCGLVLNAIRLVQFFNDVFPCLQKWKSLGIKLYTMSEGSVTGQEAFFTYTTQGNFSSLIDGYIGTSLLGLDKYDITCYTKLVDIMNEDRSNILFLTSKLQEAKAAKMAGLRVCLVLRPGNERISPDNFNL
ncbi:enolase-phosphatase E1-like isoform X1 [Dinothrombium tinctorium]|uniref:Enolase-phosphatase E1-like isoform X1 n=1 Tax=Dinothrombium tinctorium TaxID=1965070 RepID=A0A3S3P3T1_9ACAR|nr:enolase-phosphatase E1-like isoform X1 [Dinothrombium tinctorium]RWS07503.1 enolase-phosphatase E1-like isoform X1 [Dinothrombium tinctorium]RWS08015.1 enolase-phosphatase E1-like isoform X1 [Dinothrombium tinctorium]